MRAILSLYVLSAVASLFMGDPLPGLVLAIPLPVVGAVAGGLLGGLFGGGDRRAESGLDPASQAFVEQHMRPLGIQLASRFLGGGFVPGGFAPGGPGAAPGGPGGLNIDFGPESFREFLDPFTGQVVDATRAEFDRAADLARQAARSDATLAGTGRGSRGAVLEAERLGNIDRARASTIAGLLSSGFDRASQLALQRAGFNMDRMRAAQAALNAGLGPAGQVASTPGPGFLERTLGGAFSGATLAAGLGGGGGSVVPSFVPGVTSLPASGPANLVVPRTTERLLPGIRFGGRRF